MKSGNFKMADSRFLNVLAPFVSLYQKKHFEAFLAGCENSYNGQAIRRAAATYDHGEIAKAVRDRFPEMDLSKYPAFEESLII